MNNYSNLFGRFVHILPWLFVGLGIFIITFALLFFGLKVYRLWQLLKQKSVFIELTPPAANEKSALATQQLFNVLHGLSGGGSVFARLFRPPLVLSLEIVSSKSHGIRFLVRLPADKAASFEAALTAYLPEVKVGRATDYTPAHGRVVSFTQKAHFAFPLQSHTMFELQDPLAYLTGAMTKLASEELVAVQLVATPVRVAEAESLSNMVLRNEDIEQFLKHKPVVGFSALLRAINNLLFGLTDVVTYAYHGNSKNGYSVSQKENFQKQQAAMNLRPARILSPFEQELFESMHQKLTQQLFRVDIRAFVYVKTNVEAKRRIGSLASALGSFSVPKYQSLQANKYRWSQRYQIAAFKHRLPSLYKSHSSILAASELASLYHFPNRETTKTENLSKSLSRTLPAPVSLKDGTKLDILLGVNQHHGSSTPIGLTAAERDRHVYIIGGTGNGKTTMLLYGIVQDIKNGKGVAVLDPHGDLAESILRHVPKQRIKDVIYLNPDDLTHPIGINLLELAPGMTGDELLREKDLITESAISVMRKLFSDDDTGGHRIEYILRNAIQTALTLEGSTLFTVFRLLNDTKYRKDIVKNLEDHDLKIFWQNELAKAGDFQKVKMSAGITAKIGRFLFSASAKRMLEQEKSTIDFDDIINSGKILICNFSKGLLGEDTSTLFGTTILAKLQVASLRRARIKQANRSPFYLYVDEFQNFATMSFVQMLSEARKYKLFLTMAEQSTSQQDQQRLVDIILANVGTVICFRSGSPADERFVLPLFYPSVEQGEIANLPAYNFYMRLAAMDAKEPMSGITVLLANAGSERIAELVTENSRLVYAKKHESEQNKEPPETPELKQNKIPARKPRSTNTKYTEQRAGEAALMDAK